MTTTTDRLLAVAVRELGQTENPPNSNRVKYSAAYGLVGPWCSMFVWWCAREAGAGDMRQLVTPSFASCQGALNALKTQGRLRGSKQQAEKGDVVYFDWNADRHVDHTGFVLERHADGLVTVEGNTSASGSQSNGGAVMRKFRPWTTVAAVATLPNVVIQSHPTAPPAVAPAPTPPPSPAAANALGQLAQQLAYCRLFTVGDGNNTSETAVRFVQWGLNASKVAGVLVADGVWGPHTKAAVVAFQRNRHLTPDGLVGPATWSALYP